MGTVYGQFCPVAVASEIFAERWTPVILRELVLGSRRFNEIQRRVVVRFDFRGVPAAHKWSRTYWLVMQRPDVDFCIIEPGFEVDLFVDADLAALSRVWLGEVPIRQAIREGNVNLTGDRQAVRDFPS